MTYKVITPPQSEPITLEDARLHLRLGSDETSEDALITTWITVAREYAEHYTGRALVPQTLEQALDAFPCCFGAILLDMPPVTQVASIEYDDLNGQAQTLDTARWHFSDYGAARTVSLTYGSWWPPTRPQADAVRIRFTAGYETPPQAVRAALLLIVGHLFENRQDVLVSDGRAVAIEVPKAADALLDTVKAYG